MRTIVVKNYANLLLEKFPDYFKRDFEHNKKVLDDVAIIKSKKLKNQIAGYITHLLSIREKTASA
ncbi:MAG: 30S ribosomal protein S17e [Candidatus Odinarchaeia archaeon]